MYVSQGIGAPAIFQRLTQKVAQARAAASLPKPLPTTGIVAPRPVTVSPAAPPAMIVTPAQRFASTPTPVRAPAPTIVKPPFGVTALRPSRPGLLRSTMLERVATSRPPAAPSKRLAPSSPFNAVAMELGRLRRTIPTPTATPIPASLLERMRRDVVSRKPVRKTIFGAVLDRTKPSRPATPVLVPFTSATSPDVVPTDMAPVVPAAAPAPESPFASLLEEVVGPSGPDMYAGAAGNFADEELGPQFGDLDFDIALEEPLTSELPSWLEGVEGLEMTGEPEDFPPELAQLAQLDQGGDLSERELEELRGDLRPALEAEKSPGWGQVALVGAAIFAALWLAGRSRTRGGLRGGKAGW